MVENEPYKIKLRSIKKDNSLDWKNSVLSEVTIECMNYDTFTTLNDVVTSVLAKEERDANQNDEQKD